MGELVARREHEVIHPPSRCLHERQVCCSTLPFLCHAQTSGRYTLSHTRLTRLRSGVPVGLQATTPDRSATSPAVDQTSLPGCPGALGAHFCAAIGGHAAVPWEACSVKAPYSVIEEGRRKTAICRLQLLLCAAHCWVHTRLLSWHSSDFLYTLWVRASLAAAPLSKAPIRAIHPSRFCLPRISSFLLLTPASDDTYRPDDRVSTVCCFPPRTSALHVPGACTRGCLCRTCKMVVVGLRAVRRPSMVSQAATCLPRFGADVVCHLCT